MSIKFRPVSAGHFFSAQLWLSKRALESLARGLALEPSPFRMNIVSPGMIDWPLWSKVDDASRQSLFGRIAESVPAQVMGQPDDIANAVTFLLTTPFATGSTAAVRSRDVIDHVE